MKRHVWVIEGRTKGKPWQLIGYDDSRAWARVFKKQMAEEFPCQQHRIVKYIPERKYK